MRQKQLLHDSKVGVGRFGQGRRDGRSGDRRRWRGAAQAIPKAQAARIQMSGRVREIARCVAEAQQRPRYSTSDRRGRHPYVSRTRRASMRPRHFTADHLPLAAHEIGLSGASMRPRHSTADRYTLDTHPPAPECFNEAAAVRRGSRLIAQINNAGTVASMRPQLFAGDRSRPFLRR